MAAPGDDDWTCTEGSNQQIQGTPLSWPSGVDGSIMQYSSDGGVTWTQTKVNEEPNICQALPALGSYLVQLAWADYDSGDILSYWSNSKSITLT
jgi:hypothetical protein